jgi:hypothetical protein
MKLWRCDASTLIWPRILRDTAFSHRERYSYLDIDEAECYIPAFVISVWRSQEFAKWPCWLVLASLLGMGGALFGVPMAGLGFAVAFYASFGAYGAMMLRASR